MSSGCINVSGKELGSPNEIYVYTTKAPDGFAGSKTRKMTIDGVKYNYFEVDMKDKGKIDIPSKKIIKKGNGYHEEIDGIARNISDDITELKPLDDKNKVHMRVDGDSGKYQIPGEIGQSGNYATKIKVISDGATYELGEYRNDTFNFVAILPKRRWNRTPEQHRRFRVEQYQKYSSMLDNVKNVNEFYTMIYKYKGPDYFLERLHFSSPIIMPTSVKNLRYLWGKVNDTELHNLIRMIVYQSYCLSKLGYFYIDMRSENILYYMKDGKIKIVLIDLCSVKIAERIVSQYKQDELYDDQLFRIACAKEGSYVYPPFEMWESYAPPELINYNYSIRVLDDEYSDEEHDEPEQPSFEKDKGLQIIDTPNDLFYNKIVVWGIGLIILEFIGNTKEKPTDIFKGSNEYERERDKQLIKFAMHIKDTNTLKDADWYRERSKPYERGKFAEIVKNDKGIFYQYITPEITEKLNELASIEHEALFLLPYDKLDRLIGNIKDLIEKQIEKTQKDKLNKMLYDDIIEQTAEKTTSENLKTLLRATLNPNPKERPTLEQLYHDFEFNP